MDQKRKKKPLGGAGLGYMFLLKALKVAQKLGALSSLGGICCC